MIYEEAARHGLDEQRSAMILDRKHRIYEFLEHTPCRVEWNVFPLIQTEF
jgi:hypothetical protein